MTDTTPIAPVTQAEVCECANCWHSDDTRMALECLRQRDVQTLGAVLSRRDWQSTEAAYNDLRDNLDRILAHHRQQSASPSGLVAEPPVHPGDRWTERWCGSGMMKGSSIWTTDSLGCHKNMVEHVGGDEDTHASVRRIVAAHNATLFEAPATAGEAPSASGEAIEAAAEAMWQAESRRVADRDRLITWAEENEDVQDAWRDNARAAATALQSTPPTDAVREALRHQLRNCPLCKGDRKHESIDDLMRGISPRRMVDCDRCGPGWEALSAHPAPVEGGEALAKLIEAARAMDAAYGLWAVSMFPDRGNTRDELGFAAARLSAALRLNTDSGRTPVAPDKEMGR